MSYVSQNLRNASNNFFHFRQTVLIWLKRHVWIDLWLFLEILYTVDRRDGKGEVLSEARIGKKFWTVITLRKGKEKGKEIAQQVLRVCCKEEISPYEITVDLVTKRGFFFFFGILTYCVTQGYPWKRATLGVFKVDKGDQNLSFLRKERRQFFHIFLRFEETNITRELDKSTRYKISFFLSFRGKKKKKKEEKKIWEYIYPERSFHYSKEIGE